MIPGPTPVPPRILRAMVRPMMNHRGPEFKELMKDVMDGLAQLFRTKNPVLIFPSSGTGGLEASLVNTLSPGDKVLCVSIGFFGDRYADIAGKFGAQVEKLAFPWGEDADMDRVAQTLKENPGIKAVTVTQNETSTGVTNNIQAVASLVKQTDAILIVDAVSGLGAIDLQTDAWGVDVVVSGSQKALMLPPGLSFLSVSEKALEASKHAAMPRYYWDFAEMRKWMEKGQTPYTPALSLFYALQESLTLLLDEIGLARNIQLHTIRAKAVRTAAHALGLDLLAEDRCASTTVTSIRAPSGIHVHDLRRVMREEYNVVIAGGQGALTESVFRIGHLGWVGETDILTTVLALEFCLKRQGFSFESGAGVSAAQGVFELHRAVAASER